MGARREVTVRFAREYAKASKKDKGRILDDVVGVTGWSRDNARRRLTRAAKHPPGRERRTAPAARKSRGRKYSYDSLVVLQRVWAISGGMCGKYLAASMTLLLDLLEACGELEFGKERYSPQVRGELIAMSPATIDRYLRPVKSKDAIRGKTSTKPAPLLRTSITIRKAGD